MFVLLNILWTILQDVLAATTKAEEVTRNNSECTLNVALAYTSRFLEERDSYRDSITSFNKGFFSSKWWIIKDTNMIYIPTCQGRDDTGNKKAGSSCEERSTESI